MKCPDLQRKLLLSGSPGVRWIVQTLRPPLFCLYIEKSHNVNNDFKDGNITLDNGVVTTEINKNDKMPVKWGI